MLNRIVNVLLVLLTAVCFSATTVLAGPPDPVTSTVDDCLVICLGGDISFHVTVRDAAGTPLPGIPVAIDFCPCLDATLCMYGGGDECSNGKFDYLETYTDADGLAVFYPAAGGNCGENPVDIIADGVVLAQRHIMAFDLDGDFVIEESDFPTFDDFWRDFNCDGYSGLPDLAIFNNHFWHTCDAPVGEQVRSWGEIKSLWR